MITFEIGYKEQKLVYCLALQKKFLLVAQKNLFQDLPLLIFSQNACIQRQTINYFTDHTHGTVPLQNILVFNILKALLLLLLVYLEFYFSMSDRLNFYFTQYKHLLKPLLDCLRLFLLIFAALKICHFCYITLFLLIQHPEYLLFCFFFKKQTILFTNDFFGI